MFSVIIPTRNRALLLSKCVDSVLRQKYQHFELIIVDDGSTDHTKEVVLSKEDDRIKYIFQEHAERSSARNTGIAHARFQYICFVDDDDLLLPEHLSTFDKYLAAHDYPKMIVRTGYLRYNNGQYTKTINYSKSQHSNPIRFSCFNMVGVWSLCIHASFLQTEQFPAQFPHWQDTHLILRLLLKHEFVQLPAWTYVYRIHDLSGSSKAVVEYDPVARADLNVAAIKHLFEHYGQELNEYLPSNTIPFLISEKYIQYLINDFRRTKILSNILLKKSFQYGYFIRLWKYYIMLIKLKISYSIF